MDAMTAMLTRRSIRRFTDEPVDESTIKKLLEAAMAAPSAGNQQPWHFVVITERAILDEIPAIHKYAQMCREASKAILVAADPGLEKYKGYWVQDCSAAVQNILIGAHALGLGAVWCGIHPDQERVESFRKLLSIPPSIVPLALVPLGRPAEDKTPADRYNQERIHSNHW